MCGIVFAGANIMAARDVERFEQLLYADVVRGEHSTGVFAGFKMTDNSVVCKVEKAAMASDEYLRSNLWERVKQIRTPHATIANSTTITQPKFLVGHNRYATAGAVNDRNAHPFTHGPITLVHNGTLTDQTLLPEHKRFEVDSENICYSIAELGIDETVQKLHGAYTLVWFNAEDRTLNFLRNNDRPFHMLETSSGDYFGASEEDMLMWLMKRKFGPTIKRHFELVAGVQYVFEVSPTFKFKEERKHELPTFRRSYPVYQGGGNRWYNDYDDDYDYDYGRGSRQSNVSSANRVLGQSTTQTRSQTGDDPKKRELNELLEAHGIACRVGEWLHFEAFQFEAYAKNLTKGKLTGFCGATEYIEVQAHGFDASQWVDGAEYKGRIISAYEMNYILNIIVSPAERRPLAGELILPKETVIPSPESNTVSVGDYISELEQRRAEIEEDKEHNSGVVVTVHNSSADMSDNELDEEEQGDVAELTQDGQMFTKKEWESNPALCECGNCGSPIPFADIRKTVVKNGFGFCETCAVEGADEGYPKGTGSDRFVCTQCGGEFHEDLHSMKDNMCVMCYQEAYGIHHGQREKKTVELTKPVNNVLKFRATLKNGMSVTKPIWEKMNTCRFCLNPIHWNFAETTEFCGNAPMCTCCSKKMDAGILPIPCKK